MHGGGAPPQHGWMQYSPPPQTSLPHVSGPLASGAPSGAASAEPSSPPSNGSTAPPHATESAAAAAIEIKRFMSAPPSNGRAACNSAGFPRFACAELRRRPVDGARASV